MDLTADKNYNQPDQVLQPEVWATGLAQEDEEIHEFQSEEDTTGDNAEVCDEVLDSDAVPEPVPPTNAPSDDDDASAADEEEAESEDEGADYTMTAADPEEQLLIAATTSRSGRRRIATKHFAC